ncbi:AAA family ATPase [Roseobacter sp. GAI101]|uniref:AAA family ATPase n=1 Tax=Roseobacter sp. (strain GAI101) TaxID=391589 RepID=UPI0001871E76|nr:AAA family ATPase [Roseobacter sp. GAI101]EEB84675.1 Lon protease, putative [Roseobacter sp. GAI101]
MSRIPFAEVNFFSEHALCSYQVGNRLKSFLSSYRKKTGSSKEILYLSEADNDKIERRAHAYVGALGRRSGMSHLQRKDKEWLDALSNGCVLHRVETEHRADEIASALHTEMPWMAPATERIWQDMRASFRRGDLGTVIRPLLLVGPPGIGKSHWARLLGKELQVPTTVIESTSEPASFSVTGSQRGWANAGPGKPLENILATGIASPVIVVDEIEKAGSVKSERGQSFALGDGLLSLLERSTAASWGCPYFRVNFDMSWITWIMTANSTQGLSEPFLSRCPPMNLSALTVDHLQGFAVREAGRRGIGANAVGSVLEVIEHAKELQLLSLRSVLRLLAVAERSTNRPLLH